MVKRGIMALSLLLGAPAAADGALERVLDPDELGEWSAVGRVNMAGRGFCTGALVAPDLVVTAAHCLYHPVSGRRLAPDRLHFVAGQIRETWLADAGGQAVAHGAEQWREDRRFDVALLQLDAPLELAPYAVAAGSSGADVAVASYARGRAFAMAVQEPCGVLQEVRGLLVLSCLAGPGTSGAPVFARGTNGGLELIGVISGRAERPQGPVTIAVPVNAQVLDRLKAELSEAG